MILIANLCEGFVHSFFFENPGTDTKSHRLGGCKGVFHHWVRLVLCVTDGDFFMTFSQLGQTVESTVSQISSGLFFRFENCLIDPTGTLAISRILKHFLLEVVEQLDFMVKEGIRSFFHQFTIPVGGFLWITYLLPVDSRQGLARDPLVSSQGNAGQSPDKLRAHGLFQSLES